MFGFIIMDGNGSLFATLNGNHRAILHKMSVELPKKHGRGGQSALRFARLRLEKRHNYVTKVLPSPPLPLQDAYIYICMYIYIFMYIHTNTYIHSSFAHTFKHCSIRLRGA